MVSAGLDNFDAQRHSLSQTLAFTSLKCSVRVRDGTRDDVRPLVVSRDGRQSRSASCHRLTNEKETESLYKARLPPLEKCVWRCDEAMAPRLNSSS